MARDHRMLQRDHDDRLTSVVPVVSPVVVGERRSGRGYREHSE
jgi:hypothetical protein